MRVFHSQDRKNGGRRVFLAIPAYGNPTVEFTHSMWAARAALIEAGIESELVILNGNCHVDDARNQLCMSFMETSCDCMVFIDDDTRFNADDLVRLIKHDRDVVAGVCHKKTYPLDFAWRPKGGEIWTDSDGLVEAETVGTAFMKLTRDAVAKTSAVSLKYNIKVCGVEKTVSQIFERITEDGQRWGGDYSFCRKWTGLGGQIWVDPEMTFGHAGNFEWVGNLATHLRAANGLTDKYIADMLLDLKGRNATAKDILSLSTEWGNNDWSASTELLTTLDIIAKSGEGTILECGSGLSTLIMGTSGRQVIALEHDNEWADRVKKVSKSAGLGCFIVASGLKDGWYSEAPIPDDVSMVFVDGPPRWLGKREKVTDHLNVTDDCIFVVDDISESDVMQSIADKFGVKFHNFGRYAIGRR